MLTANSAVHDATRLSAIQCNTRAGTTHHSLGRPRRSWARRSCLPCSCGQRMGKCATCGCHACFVNCTMSSSLRAVMCVLVYCVVLRLTACVMRHCVLLQLCIPYAARSSSGQRRNTAATLVPRRHGGRCHVRVRVVGRELLRRGGVASHGTRHRVMIRVAKQHHHAMLAGAMRCRQKDSKGLRPGLLHGLNRAGATSRTCTRTSSVA